MYSIHKSKEFNEGYDAWMRCSSSDNPYPKDTTEYKEWADGNYIAVLEEGEAYNAYYEE